MKKIFAFLFMISFCMVMNAQNAVHFRLKADGTFLSEDNKDFVILEYKGKSAEELYALVKANVLKTYKSPKDVLSENQPTNLNVRALSEEFYSGYRLPGGFVSYSIFYNLVFHFKEGRIKVDAPLLDQYLNIEATALPGSKTFKSYVDDWFDKKGEPKAKKIKDIELIENLFNSLINNLLDEKTNNESEENW